jgi:hypothetical protein
MHLTMAAVVFGALVSVATAETRLSGTVIAASPARLTIEELGEGGVSTRRTIGLSASTLVSIARRAHPDDAARAAWPGGFVDLPVTAREVQPRDFVTVTVDGSGGAAVAVTIEVVRGTWEGSASPR